MFGRATMTLGIDHILVELTLHFSLMLSVQTGVGANYTNRRRVDCVCIPHQSVHLSAH